MALIDDINNLPTAVSDGIPGHLNNHQVIHAALKDHAARMGPTHFVGTGSPEGVVAATLGDEYTDQTAAYGAIKWLKATDAWRTGWRVVEGDTGWRDVTSLMPSPPEGGSISIRRVPHALYLQTRWLNTGMNGFTIETGNQWSPAGNSGGDLFDAGGNRSGYFRYTYAGRLDVIKVNSNSLDGMSILIPTNTWPTSYIGTPV